MELVGNVTPGTLTVSCELNSDEKGRIMAHRTCRNETNSSATHVGDISLMPRELHQRYEIETRSRKAGISFEYSSSMRISGVVAGPGRIKSNAMGCSIRNRSG